MKGIILASIMSWLSLYMLHAQRVVEGRVIDRDTKSPLAGANIYIEGQDIGAVSDAQGHFQLDIGDHTEGKLIISFVGYQSHQIPLSQLRSPLNIQLSSSNEQLNEVVVVGYLSEKRLQDVAGAVGLLTQKDFERANTFSLKPVLDLVPGLQVDQSNLTEARIAIRGIGARSAPGNRGVKFYLNDIPITEADGSNRIQGLDILTLGRAEVIRGPSSSIYGFGMAGVISFSVQRANYQENSLETEALVGSYGMRRLSAAYRYGDDRMNLISLYGWQEADGYRAYNRDMRRFFTTSMQFYPSEKQSVSLLLNRTQQFAQLPGALTIEQMQDDPRQAVPFNVTQQAQRNQTWTRIGISHTYDFTASISNTTSLFSSFIEMDHPIAFTYIRSGLNSYGGRTRFNIQPDMRSLPTRFVLGAEFISGLNRQTRYQNNQGNEGNITLNADNQNLQYSLFLQTETQLHKKLLLTLGASYNHVEYRIKDYIRPERNGTLRFEPTWTPRLALSYLLQANHSLHASISRGFAPPTTAEINNADGTVNTSLRPEIGIQYELNAKGSWLNKRLQYDLAVYRFNISNELVPQTVAQNITIFNNAGRTYRNGVEMALYFDAIGSSHSRLRRFRPFVIATYNQARFANYQILNAQNELIADYSGNALPGVIPLSLHTGFDIETHMGLYLYSTLFYYDRMPMNDINTHYNQSYWVWNAKMGYRKNIGRVGFNLYIAADNLLNMRYSSLIALNARPAAPDQNPPYFNPSPERWWFGGLQLRYHFIKPSQP